MGDWKRQIPNGLTVFRLLLAPLIFGLSIALLNEPTWRILLGILFIVCCFTDFLDGYLARRWGAESDFGKTFDPVADKVLIVGMMIILLANGRIIGWVGIILVSRDLLMDFLRVVLYRKKIIIPAILSAKIKTVLQMIGIAMVMLWNDASSGKVDLFPNGVEIYLKQLALVLAMAFSLWSFGVYLHRLRNANT